MHFSHMPILTNNKITALHEDIFHEKNINGVYFLV